MITIRQTSTFKQWFSELRDASAKARIVARLRRIEIGNMGDVKAIEGGVSEIRIDHGPGYRLYFTRRGADVIVLICGGDKSSQKRDIKAAIAMAKEI